MSVAELSAAVPEYREVRIPKRSGGERVLHVPSDSLKKVQRKILRGLLGKLKPHDAVHGFREGRSIVTNAKVHAGKSVVLRMDIRDFFSRTAAIQVFVRMQVMGWDAAAAEMITRLTTYRDGLPQGAPTSPQLSNVVLQLMDEKLHGLALSFGAVYTRYADDLTFSFKEDLRRNVGSLILYVQQVVEEFGYKLHTKKKLRISRQHQRMVVTGLVVNERVQLPRETRRKLRAVRHHLNTGRPATMTPAQLAGWDALASMVDQQAKTP